MPRSTGSPRSGCACSAMAPDRASLPRSGYWLGFALGGFFDGILLHQILQWHHLLSLVEGVGDQILYDGLFHALMYLVALAGLVLLVRERRALVRPGGGRALIAALLIGAGAWHVADALLSHWLLGIHRIRIDTPTPLAWDIGWLLVFGIVPIALGRMLARRGGGAPPGAPTLVAVAAIVLAGGAWAARIPAGSDTAIVVFRAGTGQAAAVNAILAADGRLLWHSGHVWAVRWAGRPRPTALYRADALFVSTSLGGAACLAWTR